MTRPAEIAGSWRVALRMARRATRRHRGRSALILVMLIFPAYAATVLAASWANLSGTSAQEITFSMGGADLIVQADDLNAVTAALPPGSRTLPLVQARTVVHGPAGLRAHEYEATDLADPLNRGRYVLRAGRAPRGPAEVALTRALAAELDAHLGSQIRAGTPQRRLTVVGVVDWSRSLRAAGLLVPANAPLSPGVRTSLMVQLPAGHDWRPPQPGTRAASGLSYRDRTQMGPSTTERAVEAAAALLVTGLAGTQVLLLAGAAFVVGAHRQSRELAVLAAAGATSQQTSRVVLAEGLLLGAGAATVAPASGLLTFAAARQGIERIADHPLIDVSIPWGSVAAVAAVTLSVGVLAALLPARAVARRPIRTSLGGQRARSRLDLVGLAAGMSLVVAGTAALLVSGNPQGRPELLAVGAIAQLLGVVACAPALIRAAGRLAGALPMPGRVGVRHAARHRMRTGAAVAAVIAAVAGSVALALVGAARAEAVPARPEARPGQVLLPAEAADLLGPDGLGRFSAALPTRAAVVLQTVTDAAGVPTRPARPPEGAADPGVLASMEQRDVAVGGEEIIHLVTGRVATAEEVTILNNGGAVVFNDSLIGGDHITLLLHNGDMLRPMPAMLAAHGEYFAALPGLVISPATAQRLGLAAEPRRVIVDTDRAPGDGELDAANDVLLRAQLATATPPPSPITATVVAIPSSAGQMATMFYLLAAVSGLVTVVASTVAVGLAAVELRGDLATMAAVGATPRVRRRIVATQAAVIVGLGAVLGLLAGLGPAAGYVGYSTELRWHTPWRALLLIVLVPPVLTSLLIGALARGRLPLTRRTS